MDDVKALIAELERIDSELPNECVDLSLALGKVIAALAAPRPQPDESAKTEEMAEWGDAVAAIAGCPGAPPAEAFDRLVKAGDALQARIGVMTLARMLHVCAAPRPSGEPRYAIMREPVQAPPIRWEPDDEPARPSGEPTFEAKTDTNSLQNIATIKGTVITPAHCDPVNVRWLTDEYEQCQDAVARYHDHDPSRGTGARIYQVVQRMVDKLTSRPSGEREAPASLPLRLVERFRFESFQHWVTDAHAMPWDYINDTVINTCVDAKGRVCRVGSDFERAAREDAYPVVAYAVVEAQWRPSPPGERPEIEVGDWVLCVGEGVTVIANAAQAEIANRRIGTAVWRYTEIRKPNGVVWRKP